MLFSANHPLQIQIAEDVAIMRIYDPQLNKNIFNSKIFRMPDEPFILIDVNPIIVNHLNHTIYTIGNKISTTSYIKNYELVREFYVYVDEILYTTFWATYNWSDIPTFDDRYISTNNISSEFYPNQLLFFNVNSKNLSTNVNIYFNSTVLGSYTSDTSQMITVNTAQLSLTKGDTINFDSDLGNVKMNYNPCPIPYMIYYINEFGAMSYLPIQHCKLIDSFERSEITRHFDKGTTDFGRTNIDVQIAQKYECTTQILNEYDIPYIKSLMASTKIYLHNLNTHTITPVIITNKDLDWKKVVKRKDVIQYTLNLESSQFEKRR